MRSYSLVLLTAVFTSWFAGCASPNATSASTPPRAKNEAVDGLFPTLTKGMTADVIRQKMGAPAQIEPMQSPEGHAEVWVYHFEKDLGVVYQATGTTMIPAIVSRASGLQMTGVPQATYSPVEVKSWVTLRLLMFNGQLTSQKAMVEKGVDY